MVIETVQEAAGPGEDIQPPRRARSAAPSSLTPGAQRNTSLIDAWRQHQPALARYSLHLLGGNHVDAEDVLGSVVLRILEHFPGEMTIRDPVALFYRLIFNASMDIHRRRRRESLQPVEGTDEPAMAEVAADNMGSDSAEQQYLRRELFRELGDGIEALPDRLRGVLLQRIAETPYPDIARYHGISIENARKQVQLARDFLRLYLRSRELLR